MASLAVTMAAVVLTGCGKLPGIGLVRVEAKTAEDNLDAFLTYQDALLGKDSNAVIQVLGKPRGIFEKQSGKVWMYARWCVEFDARGSVVKLERDIATSAASDAEPRPSMALAAKPAPLSQPAATTREGINASKCGPGHGP